MTSPILVIPPRDTGGRGPPAAASSPASVDRLESGGWEEAQPDRVLATVLFSDIAGASETAPSLGDRAWRELLERHHELLRRQPVRFRGKELDTAGDGFLATFDGPARGDPLRLCNR